MRDFLLNLLLPPESLLGQTGAWLPPNEEAALLAEWRPSLLGRSELRGRGITHVDCLLAATRYRDAPLTRLALQRWKYRGIRAYAPPLVRLIVSAASLTTLPTDAVACPVPLHWSRRWERGFNQADLLAQAIAREGGFVYLPLLKRRRRTGPQARTERSERLAALDGAFAWSVTGSAPATVLLVDDVCTTGGTLNACACALKAAGVQSVTVVVVCLS